MRRNLFYTELERWAVFTGKLEGVVIGQDSYSLWWNADNKGTFSMKSAFLAITSSPSPKLNTATTSLIWNFKVPKKVKFFLWTLFYRGTNTTDKIQRKLPYWTFSPSVYVMCVNNVETVDHFFLHCTFATSLGTMWHLS